MIFDIAASIGTKRKYLVLNGVDVSPFEFSNLENPYYYNTYPNPFVISHSEVPHTITLKSKDDGYTSDYDKSYQGLCKIDLNRCFENANENIRDYRNLCVVVSFKNYDDEWPSGNEYSIATATDAHSTTMHYYDIEIKSLTRIDDGKKAIYKFDLENFYNLDEIGVRFYRSTIVVKYGEDDSQLHIHAMYFE